MRIRHLTPMSAAAALLLAVPPLLFTAPHAIADSAEPAEDPEEIMDLSDRNDDDHIDLHEFHGRMVDVFYMADGDRDGHLDPAEHRSTQMGDFNEHDRNGDGKVDLHELMRGSTVVFEAADTDDDGRLSEKEVMVTYDEAEVPSE